MTQNYNILCCDGGGIRGLLPAILIDKLSANTNLLSNASLFAGTSTGGIIALALAANLGTSEIVDLYSQNCSTIFAKSPAASYADIAAYVKGLIPAQYVGTISNDLVDLIAVLCESGVLPYNLFSAKYANDSLTTLLGQKLGTQTVGDVKPVFVTTFLLNSSAGQWSPTSIDNLSGSSTSACTLVEAALSTGAAPTYFPPYLNNTLAQYCADGGTFANNPSTFVLAKVLSMGVDLSQIRLLSISTGQTTNNVPSSYFGTVDPTLWGTYQYMLPENAPATTPSELIINLMMDGSSAIDDTQTAAILGSNYLRVNVPLTTPVLLDDCSSVGTLTTLADDFFAANQSMLEEWVNTNFV